VGSSFFDLAKRQRAWRQFTDQPVDDADIAIMLEAATKAPSSENLQPWQFVVVRDEARRRALGDHLRAAWAAGGRDYIEGRLPRAMVDDIDRGQRGGIAAAPVLIVVGGDTDRVPEKWLASSIFPAVQNLLLAAGALGLGSALTTLVAANRPALAELVGFPDHVRAMAMLPIGYPARPLGAPRRESFAVHAWRESYGQPW
jgi:nitroreductase